MSEYPPEVHALWSDMAASQVIRHMDGAPLVPVSMAFAAQAYERIRKGEIRKSAVMAARLESPKTPTGPLSAIERQVLAGYEMEMPASILALNLSIKVERVDEALDMLRKRGII